MMFFKEYTDLFNSMKILPEKEDLFLSRVNAILKLKDLYKEVAIATGIPWDLVGVIHSLESDLSLDRHLHNGDPLTQRTVNIPKGRPKEGFPPFTWIESATDALMSIPRPDLWNTEWKLYFLEGYNGFGYRRHHVNSPYLWAGTDKYKAGKFVEDGKFDKTAVSKQLGGAPLIWCIYKTIQG